LKNKSKDCVNLFFEKNVLKKRFKTHNAKYFWFEKMCDER